MKKLLTMIAVAMLGWCASAQTYVTNDLAIATTITNGATHTVTATNYVDCTRYSEVCFEFSFQGTNANTAPATISFVRSGRLGVWETTPFTAITLAANGTSAVVGLTNIQMGAAGYIKPYQIIFTTASNDVTNAVLKAIQKGYRRD